LADQGRRETEAVTSPRASSVFAGFRFPREAISVAVRWYLRYGLSYRDVEDWPAVPPACPPGTEGARAAVDDLEPYVLGSFDDVLLAYDLGQLTEADYETLANAAAN
jgi:hypothetical protein